MGDLKCKTCNGAKTIEFERGQRNVPCIRCSGTGIDWRKSCESAQVELAALREELAQSGRADHLRQRIAFLTSEIHKQAESLTTAEQRNASLTDLLVHTLAYYTESCFPEDLLLEVKVAIGSVKPTESGASE